MPNPAWSRAWPTEPGWYWFHGRPSKRKPVGLFIVRATRTNAGRIACDAMNRNGDWDYTLKQGVSSGLWLRVPEPEEPTDA